MRLPFLVAVLVVAMAALAFGAGYRYALWVGDETVWEAEQRIAVLDVQLAARDAVAYRLRAEADSLARRARALDSTATVWEVEAGRLWRRMETLKVEAMLYEDMAGDSLAGLLCASVGARC